MTTKIYKNTTNVTMFPFEICWDYTFLAGSESLETPGVLDNVVTLYKKVVFVNNSKCIS